MLLAGGCATIPQSALLIVGGVYLGATFGLSEGTNATGVPGPDSRGLDEIDNIADNCAFMIAGGDMIYGNYARTGGWDPQSRTHRFVYELDISDAEKTRTAYVPVAVTMAGEARIDVQFDEHGYLSCGGENSIQKAIRVGPGEASRTAVAAMPISGGHTLSVMLRADHETRRPIWCVERYVEGRQNYVVRCEIDAKSGVVLRQGFDRIVESYSGI